MFDIGFLELLICGVIALLVLGPERLPTAARAAGRWIGGARRMVYNVSVVSAQKSCGLDHNEIC